MSKRDIAGNLQFRVGNLTQYEKLRLAFGYSRVKIGGIPGVLPDALGVQGLSLGVSVVLDKACDPGFVEIVCDLPDTKA